MSLLITALNALWSLVCSENVTNVTIKNAADKSKVIGSLTAGRTYYVRLRTYKKVNEVNYWSAWSPVKTVK